jgi:hypothetical protein
MIIMETFALKHRPTPAPAVIRIDTLKLSASCGQECRT